MPPQYSSTSSRSVMPAGATCTPGFATRPDTENERRPLRPWRPCPAHPPAPRQRARRITFQRGDLAREELAARRVLVAQVQPNDIAPMSLLDYKSARPWA